MIAANCRLTLRTTAARLEFSRGSIFTRSPKTPDADETVDSKPSFLEEEEAAGAVEAAHPGKFNKSRLLPQHRNMLLNKMPYQEPHSWIHLSEKYQRKMFGRYGAASEVNPRICFATRDDLEAQAVYERIAHPKSFETMLAQVREENALKREKIQKREEDIAQKLAKLEQWKSELNARTAKKEAETQAAKARKERLIEEVRRHFGYKIDPRDEKFKEMLEKKEKEDKRMQKDAKRKAREEKLMTKLIEKQPTS